MMNTHTKSGGGITHRKRSGDGLGGSTRIGNTSSNRNDHRHHHHHHDRDIAHSYHTRSSISVSNSNNSPQYDDDLYRTPPPPPPLSAHLDEDCLHHTTTTTTAPMLVDSPLLGQSIGTTETAGTGKWTLPTTTTTTTTTTTSTAATLLEANQSPTPNTTSTRRRSRFTTPPTKSGSVGTLVGNGLEHDDEYGRTEEWAVQFVERTSREMHEIVQYWLSSSSISYDDEPDEEDREHPLPLPPPRRNGSNHPPNHHLHHHNTLWNFAPTTCWHDEQYDDDNSATEMHDVDWPWLDDHTRQRLFDNHSSSSSSSKKNDTAAIYDFDPCVEGFFTELDECQRTIRNGGQHSSRSPPPPPWGNHHHAAGSSVPSEWTDEYDEDDNHHHHHHHHHPWADLLYSNDWTPIQQQLAAADGYAFGNSDVNTPPRQSSSSASSSLSLSLPKWIITWQQQQQQEQRQYHPYMMIHSKKVSSFQVTTTNQSFWQWIDQKLNDDLQRQQLHRRVSYLIFIISSVLILLVICSLFIRSIPFIFSTDGYDPFVPNDEVEHIAGATFSSSSFSCLPVVSR